MKCARAGCGLEFEPRDPRQRYHDPDCKQQAFTEKREVSCLNCKTQPAVDPHGRFCSAACCQSYVQRKRPGRKPREWKAVTVLLPAGCNPVRTVAPLVAPESTEPYGSGNSYGEVARRVWCARYERCLSHAVSLNWKGFDCRECEVDEPDINAPRNKRSNWEW